MINTFYAPQYGANTIPLSMRKLPLVADEVVKKELAVLRTPQDVENIIHKLKTVHDADYVDAFVNGIGKLASSSGLDWSEEIRDGVLWSNAGLLEGVKYVLTNKLEVGSSLSQGFHHAVASHGDAFCTFNGLALAASELPDKKIFVLDVDSHQGNGTAEFTESLKNLFACSLFRVPFEESISRGLRKYNRLVYDWSDLEASLWEACLMITRFNPDVVIYQAGADAYIKDDLGCGYLTEQELIERDRTVFKFLKEMNIPVVFVLAGGYNEQDTVRLHTNTFEVANEIYYKNT